MFVRLADGLTRQNQDGEIGGQHLAQDAEHAVGNRAIGCNRQMRSMLFGGGDRQNRDRFGIECGEVPRRQFIPMELIGQSHSPNGF